MRRYFIIAVILFLFFLSDNTNAQTNAKINNNYYSRFIPSDSIKFNLDILENIVLKKLNDVRKLNRLDEFKIESILDLPAENQSAYMARINELLAIQTGLFKTSLDRMRFYGGSKKSVELLLSVEIDYKRKRFSWEETAEKIVRRLTILKEYREKTLNPSYFLIGIGINANKDFSNLYVSLVLGNYLTFNEGADKRDELHIPYYTSFISNNIRYAYGYLPYDKEVCKPIDRLRNLDELQKGLSIENKKIYFETKNTKLLKKILKTSDDKIAVDVIPKILYPCDDVNLIDNNLLNKGILLKGLNLKQLKKRNIYKDEQGFGLKTKIGKLHYVQDLSGLRRIEGDTELNLVLIKDNHVCRTFTPTYLEFSKKNEKISSGLLVDTALNYSSEKIAAELFEKPVALEFIIPFKKGKYEYKKSDIVPLLLVLNEPKYNIKYIKISAFTSIEGTEDRNEFLQKARAESIVKAFNEIQDDTLKFEILANDSWDLFKRDVIGTKYDTLSKFNRDEAKSFILKNKLESGLELVFARHRFAKVELKVVYDTISSTREFLTVKRVNKYIEGNNIQLAEMALKHLIKNIFAGKYEGNEIENIAIPAKKEFASLRMNYICLQKYINNENIHNEDLKLFESLYKMVNNNYYINYNYLYAYLYINDCIDFNKELWMNEIMEELKKSSIDKKKLTTLEFRLKIKKYKFFIENRGNRGKASDLYDEISMSISSESEALGLAYILASTGDYLLAIELLGRFINDDVSEKLLFTYISLCSHVPEMYYTKKFENASKRAFNKNKNKFCNLVNEGKFSIQIFENPVIKYLYCKQCN